jgi:predicted ATPase/DNA-binding SARP family transcriptional activator
VQRATPEARRPVLTNLPAPLSRLIGRQREIAEIRRLAATARLLTITGPGGCGKTRLALATGLELLPRFADGAWLVELAPLSDQSMVAQTVAAALGVPEQPGRSVADTLADSLTAKQLLLVLDNCEHVLVACAHLARRLLASCPRLTILATSRERLKLAGETVYLTPSLSLPDTGASSPEVVMRSEAVCLFVERATSVQPAFVLDDHNAAALAEICLRVDGIPLAIELAAAWTRVLTLSEIAIRLDDACRLLTLSSPTSPARQQTLGAAIDWSYTLLSAPESALLRRLAVFTGSFTLAAAEQTPAFSTEPDERAGTVDVLHLLAGLVDKSLLAMQQDERAAEARFRLLEPIRQYAYQKLEEEGEAKRAHERHFDFYLSLAQTAEPHLASGRRAEWIERLRADHSNLRAALEWSLSTAGSDNGDRALRLAAALGLYWLFAAHTREGRVWAERVLAVAPAPSIDRARVLSRAGHFAVLQGDGALATTWSTECVALCQTPGAKRELVDALIVRALAAMVRGDLAQAVASAQEARALAREVGDTWRLALALSPLAQATARQGNAVAARAYMEEAIALWQELGDRWGSAFARMGLGLILLSQGDMQAARRQLEESLGMLQEIGDRQFANVSRAALADVARRSGDDERAIVLYIEVISQWRDLGNRGAVARCFECVAFIWITQAAKAPQQERSGLLRRAARILAAAEALRAAASAVMTPPERAEYESHLAALRDQLDEPALGTAWVDGSAVTFEQAVATLTDPRGQAPAQTLSATTLRIFGLGPARVLRGSDEIATQDWTYSKAREVVFYLLSDKSRTREQIGLDLWPDASTDQLRDRLGVALHHARRVLGDADWIRFENNVYSFNRSGGFWFDVDEFAAHLGKTAAATPAGAIEHLRAATDLYHGDFLEDMPDGEWYLGRREELRRLYQEALLTLGRLLSDDAQYGEAADVLRRLIASDNYMEAAHRELMRCYVRMGERGRALRQYRQLLELMRDELGSLPAQESTALYERLRRGEGV